MVHSPDPQGTESPPSPPAGDVTLPYAKWQGRKRRNWRRIALVLLAVVCIGGAFTVKHFGGTFREAGVCSNCYHIETRRVWYFHKTRLRTVTVSDVSQKRLDWNDFVADEQQRPCLHRYTWYADVAYVDTYAEAIAIRAAANAMTAAYGDMCMAQVDYYMATDTMKFAQVGFEDLRAIDTQLSSRELVSEIRKELKVAKKWHYVAKKKLDVSKRKLDAAMKDYESAVEKWEKLNARRGSGG